MSMPDMNKHNSLPISKIHSAPLNSAQSPPISINPLIINSPPIETAKVTSPNKEAISSSIATSYGPNKEVTFSSIATNPPNKEASSSSPITTTQVAVSSLTPNKELASSSLTPNKEVASSSLTPNKEAASSFPPNKEAVSSSPIATTPNKEVNSPSPVLRNTKGSCAQFLRQNPRYINEPICQLLPNENGTSVRECLAWRASDGGPDDGYGVKVQGGIKESLAWHSIQKKTEMNYNSSSSHQDYPDIPQSCKPKPLVKNVKFPTTNPINAIMNSSIRERISYHHDYNSRATPNEPPQGQLHGNFVWEERN